MQPPYEGVPPEERGQLSNRLALIEKENDVRILYACESGSRAWGFPSKDSDYDVRFLYLNRPGWYLSVGLEEQRDVIETPIEGLWDVNGWDLRKALRLFRKSNPPLLEWLQSPIVYLETSSAASRMRKLVPSLYSAPASMYHYLHMAQKNYRGYLQTETVWTKKYFYVLRPVLACRWVEQSVGAVPMEFQKLVESAGLPAPVREAIETLLKEKRSGAELSAGPKIPALDDFINAEFARHERNGVVRKPPRADVDQLSQLFHSVLEEVWGVVLPPS